LADAAVRELQAAAAQEDGTWAPPEMARVYQDGGRYDRGIEIMKRTTPNYFAVDLPDLPASLLGGAFPESLLGRSAQIFRAQWPRSLSRSLAHKTGIRIQRDGALARECGRPDAAPAENWKNR